MHDDASARATKKMTKKKSFVYHNLRASKITKVGAQTGSTKSFLLLAAAVVVVKRGDKERTIVSFVSCQSCWLVFRSARVCRRHDTKMLYFDRLIGKWDNFNVQLDTKKKERNSPSPFFGLLPLWHPHNGLRRLHTMAYLFSLWLYRIIYGQKANKYTARCTIS